MPDVGELRECHHPRRRVDADREVVGRPHRAGDRVANLVENDLLALANAVAIPVVVSVLSSANRPDATSCRSGPASSCVARTVRAGKCRR